MAFRVGAHLASQKCDDQKVADEVCRMRRQKSKAFALITRTLSRPADDSSLYERELKTSFGTKGGK